VRIELGRRGDHRITRIYANWREEKRKRGSSNYADLRELGRREEGFLNNTNKCRLKKREVVLIRANPRNSMIKKEKEPSSNTNNCRLKKSNLVLIRANPRNSMMKNLNSLRNSMIKKFQEVQYHFI
jgi:hypothetical protein